MGFLGRQGAEARIAMELHTRIIINWEASVSNHEVKDALRDDKDYEHRRKTCQERRSLLGCVGSH
eukprot:350755-Amphidinium_carterae.1